MSILLRPALYPTGLLNTGAEEHVGSERPHVVLLVDQFPKALGGGERILLQLASRLPEYGFAVSIVTFFIDPESNLHSMLPACPLYTLPLTSAVSMNGVRAAAGFAEFLREKRVSIVQTFFESSDLWGGLVTKTMSDAKLIWSRRDMGILRTRKHGLAYRLLSFLPDRVFAVSEQVRQQSIQIDRLEPARVCTIYNGLDVAPGEEAPRQDRSDEARLHIATVGNIRAVKGHDVLVRAAATVIACLPGVRFTVAGGILDGGYYDRLRELIDVLGIAGQFQFAGEVRDVPAFLQSADIFVLPSRSEGFSNSIIEAMAASLPVVATDVGGNAEAIGHGESGLIVPAGDEHALADALLAVCRDRELAHRLGAAARLRVRERFSTSAMMRRTVEAYQAVLDGR